MQFHTSHRRPSRWLLPMIAVAVLAPILLIPASMLERSAPGIANVLGAIGFAGLVAGLVGAFVSARARTTHGRVTFGPDGMQLGEAFVPRAEIGDAVLVPATGGAKAHVEVRSKSGAVLTSVDVRDDAQGKEVLHALELGARERVARFDCMTPRGSFTSKLSLGLFAFGLVLAGMVFFLQAPWLFAAVVPLWLAASVIRPASMFIGADGLRMKGRAEDTFLSWKEIESVEPYASGVVVKRKNGAPALQIPVTSSPVEYGWEKGVIHGIVERVREAREVHASGEPVNAEAWLVRGTRSKEEWRLALFGDRAATFRESALREDDLWKVLEDPSANAGARGAAAAVLTRKADEGARARIRVAADACAGERLRVALDRAAAGATEEELAEALGEIEEDDAKRRASALLP